MINWWVLKIVYRIRNLFAHGAFVFHNFEYSEDYDLLDNLNLTTPLEIPIIVASSKNSPNDNADDIIGFIQ